VTPPLIALSATSELVRQALRVRLNAAYTRAIEHAGGLPVIVPPVADAASLGALLDRVDAVVITGGEDVDPARYGHTPHARAGAPHIARDATEIALVAGARERSLPTLAICRGIQLLNVALGGTLVQDIVSERPGALDHDPEAPRSARVHDVVLEHDSALARILGATSLRVNSIHHQAIDRVAESLRVTARAPDGIIEGVEGSDAEWWVVGVQWHPEELIADPEPWDRALLAALVDRARASSSASASRREPVA
jgi:putative glutamine amidotransferase